MTKSERWMENEVNLTQFSSDKDLPYYIFRALTCQFTEQVDK